MEPKYRKFYVDWWRIKKSSVYGAIAGLIFLGLLIGGGWWLIKSNYLFEDKGNLDAPKDAARLISFEGDVRIIRASTRQADKVTQKTFVLAGDTIQTGSDSKAQIEMIDGSLISVRPNSTMVIRDSSSLFGGTNVRVSLGDGQINVKTDKQTDSTKNVVEVKESENRLLAETEASFNINQKTNGGEIRISRGGVESNVGGEKIVIKESEYAAVNNGKIASRESLLNPPALIAPPALDQVLVSGNGAADINFRWDRGSSAASFSVQISNSPFFVADSMIKETEGVSDSAMMISNLAPGNYYWRVKGKTPTGQTSEWSEPWRFTVVRRDEGSAIIATDWKVEDLGGGIYRVSAKTQPGSTVRAAGKETFAVGDGSFLLQVKSRSSEIPVDFSDDKGNRSRYSLSLTSSKATKQN